MERPHRLSLLLALAWMLFLVGWHLVPGGLWLVPVYVVDTVAETLPTLRFGPYFGEFARGRLLDCAVVIGILAAAFALGAVTFDRWLPRRDLLTGLLCLSGGLWMLAAATLAVGIVSITHVPWLLLTLGAWALPAPRRFFKVGQASCLSAVSGVFGRDRQDACPTLGWTIFLVAVIAWAALSSLPGALAPPFEYDELEYHLGALADYQRAGRIIFLPHNFYSNLPQLTEMLYLLASVAASDVAAKLLHWVFGLLAALGVFALGARWWGRSVSVLAAALFYCTAFVPELSITARIDLATTFYAVLAFGAFLEWRRSDTPHWWWWSALLAGGAVATKWTAIAIVVLPLLIVVLVSRPSIRLITVYCSLITVVILPWLAKNWLLAGNPVYPLFGAWLPSPHWTADQAALFAQKHYPPPWTWAQAIEFFRQMWRYAFHELQPGPLLLMTAPLALLVRRVDATARRVGWLLLAGYAGWFALTFRPVRFLFPVTGLAALLGAYAVSALAPEGWRRAAARVVIGAVLVVNVVVPMVTMLGDMEDPDRQPPQLSYLHVMTGQASREEFLARLGTGIFEPIFWMNRHLPADAQVLCLGEARLYYAERTMLWSTAFDQHPLAAMMREAGTVEQLAAALRRAGVTHVYLMHSELSRLHQNYGYLAKIDWITLRAFLDWHARPIHVVPNGIVYELRD